MMHVLSVLFWLNEFTPTARSTIFPKEWVSSVLSSSVWRSLCAAWGAGEKSFLINAVTGRLDEQIMRGVSEDALLNPIVWWPSITKYIWHKILWREILACYSFFLYDRDVYCKIQGSVPRVVFCCYEIKYLNVAQSELYWQVSGRGHKPRTWFTLYWSFHFSYSPLWELSLTWRPCLISFLHMHSSCIDRCASWYNIFGSRNVRLRANGGIDGSIFFFPDTIFVSWQWCLFCLKSSHYSTTGLFANSVSLLTPQEPGCEAFTDIVKKPDGKRCSLFTVSSISTCR